MRRTTYCVLAERVGRLEFLQSDDTSHALGQMHFRKVRIEPMKVDRSAFENVEDRANRYVCGSRMKRKGDQEIRWRVTMSGQIISLYGQR